MDLLMFLLMFVALTCVVAVVFVVWLTWSVLALVGRGVASVFRRPPVPHDLRSARCGRRDCLAVNPVEAKFCRRCGGAMPTPQRVEARPVYRPMAA